MADCGVTEQYHETVEECRPEQETSNTVHQMVQGKRKLQTKIHALQRKCLSQAIALKSKRRQLAKLQRPLHKRLLTDDQSCVFYTGLPTCDAFTALVIYAKSFCSSNTTAPSTSAKLRLKYHRKWHHSYSVIKKNKLLMEDRILLTLMKLRLGLMRQDLADR